MLELEAVEFTGKKTVSLQEFREEFIRANKKSTLTKDNDGRMRRLVIKVSDHHSIFKPVLFLAFFVLWPNNTHSKRFLLLYATKVSKHLDQLINSMLK